MHYFVPCFYYVTLHILTHVFKLLRILIHVTYFHYIIPFFYSYLLINICEPCVGIQEHFTVAEIPGFGLPNWFFGLTTSCFFRDGIVN
jgi:hypothetical protein